MQSLQPLQNRLFGLKIKFPKQMWKCSLQVIYKCCVQKTAWKTLNIREMRRFWKLAIMQGL